MENYGYTSVMEQILFRFHGLSHWQIGFLATLLLAQGFAISIFPEELVILSLGALSATGRIGFAESMIFVLAGLLPANLTTVFIARHLGLVGLRKRPFSWVFHENAIQKFLHPAKCHAKKIVLTTRFVPLIRGPIYAALGISGLSPFAFFRLDAAAALVQVPLLLYLGRSGARLTSQQLSIFGEYVALSALLAFACIWARKRFKPAPQIEPISQLSI